MDLAMAALGLFMMVVGLLLLGSFGALVYYIYKRGQGSEGRAAAHVTIDEG